MLKTFPGLVAIAAWTLFAATANAAFISSAAAASESAALGGPAVPGVCLLSQAAVFDNAKVGQTATVRLRQLAQDAAAPLAGERQAIEIEAKTLATEKTSLSAAQLLQARQQALADRARAYEVKMQDISRQLEATRVKALRQITEAAQPIVAQVYLSRGCGLLLSRDVVLGGNLSGDLTPAVIRGLDAKINSIAFDLEPVPPAPTGGPATGQ